LAAAFTAYPGGVIDGGEIVILAIKPSMWRPLFDSGAWLVVSCVLAVLVSVLGSPLPTVSSATATQLVLLAGLARLGVALARWAPRWHLLTNRRTIDIRGLRTPQVTSCPLVAIRNTYVRRSPVESAAGVGTILFVPTGDAQTPFAWRSVAQPDSVHAKIRRAIENAIDLHACTS
jgi:hypothetical protein